VTVSLDQLASHNQLSDCWVSLGNRVYNATDFIVQNPDSNFAKQCGTQASFQGMNRQRPLDANRMGSSDFNRLASDSNRLGRPPMDFNRNRPTNVQNPLEPYFVGTLVQ